MHSATWFRRAAWPMVLGIIMTAPSTSFAQDDGPAPEGPPDGPRERFQAIVRRVEPGYQLKMAVSALPRALDAQLKLDGQGVLVTHVQKDGPADKAGIKTHDILLAAEDKPLDGPGDLLKAAEQSEGKEITLKLRRAGEEMSVTVTPEKALAEVGVAEGDDAGRRLYVRKLSEIERTIREKVKDAGVDMRLQFIQPGTWLPRGVDFAFARQTDLPDDLSIEIHKQGKEPADIEVKKGEQSWTVKEDDLAPLPDEVRRHVEGFLGRGPMRFNVIGPDGPVLWDGPRPPRPPREAERPDRPGRADREGPGVRGRFEREAEVLRGRVEERLERRLDEMTRRMHELHEQLEGLRRNLREELRERPDRPRRPDRPEPPEEESKEDDA